MDLNRKRSIFDVSINRGIITPTKLSKMTTKNEILELAREANLTTVEITYGMNGYPQRLGDWGIIGFDNMEAAEKFAKDNGGEVSHFESRDGWHFWNQKGNAWKPYTSDNMLSDMGDNYSFADSSNEFYAEQLKDIAADFDGDFTDLEVAIKRIKEIIEAVESADDDEDVIVHEGRYYDTVKKEMMRYNHDTHRYAIGVLITKDFGTDEEAE